MAQFIPSIEKIQQFRVQPTEGEWHLLHFLEGTLDDSYEIYFNPFLNGDRPDVVIMCKGGGVMIIEVKDWNLDLYTVDEKRHWHLKHPQNDGATRAILSSPVQQAFKYKENLFELHIPGLLELKIKDIRNFNFVTCAVYFHNANEQQVRDLIINPFQKDKKYLNFLKYNVDLLSRDSLQEANFKRILYNRYLVKKHSSVLFTDALYLSFKQHLTPTRHMKSEGVNLSYSRDQKRLIYDNTSRCWRVKGVVGSGKTTVLAAKAIESCKRVLSEGRIPRILILTYNVTLKNFIRDKLSRVRADFEWSYFTILNYHNFIGTMMNELGIPFEMPKQNPNETHIQYMRRVSPYLNANYYNNKALFVDYASSINKYDAIFIDEIQDYIRPWMDIVKDNFLATDGEYYLFGDVKQNIYSRQVSQKDITTNIIGAPRKLDTCFRADMKIRDLAVGFQNEFFQNKYEIDTLVAEPDEGLLFGRDELQHGSIRYINLSLPDPIIVLNTIITGNIANKDNQSVHPNDITILGTNIDLLKKIDSYYRYIGNGDTATMFETYDLMFIQHLNYFGNEAKNIPVWINELFQLVGQISNPKRARGNQIIGGFLARYELYREYPGNFGPILEVLCRRYRFEFKDFLTILARYEDEYVKFRDEVFKTDGDYSKIRDNKKLNFYMNTGTIKISTIHSFKGWESEVVFLLLEKKNEGDRSFDEILYTGLTRTRSNLIVINLGNTEYHEKMKRLIETYK
ncbi:MAG: ATP-binding domain-containing protein [Bacteroides sp.]|nr:ATP-binding domain-containing protein [Bacteroides sp.]